MTTPLVTISLVTYNQESFIKETIENCLVQKVDFDYEIIIHDDASTDKTPDIIREYAEKYPEKIIPILQTENQFSLGTEIISKFIIPKAKGKYISFLEGDDYWIDKNKLQLQVDFMETHQDVSMCFTASQRINMANPDKSKIRSFYNNDRNIPTKDVILIGGSLIDMCTVVVKREVFSDIPSWYYVSQMWDNTIPLLSTLHGEIYYLDKVTAAYRENLTGSYTQLTVKAQEKRRTHILKTLKLLEGFDQATNNKYQMIINRKIRVISNGLLLLLETDDENFKKYYSQLTPGLKLEYHLFKLIGNYTLWKKYRYLLSYFRKIKYV